jgi:hypothetical protein
MKLNILNNFLKDENIYRTAKKSSIHKKYIAFLIYRGKIVSYGLNDFKGKEHFIRHEDEYKPNKHTIHAEVACINNIKDKSILSKCSILIYKIIDDEIIKTSCCINCYKIIKKYKIRRII